MLGGYVAFHTMYREAACFGNGVFLYADGKTIQGLSYRLESGSSMGLVRGHITKIYRHGDLIGDYLDTSHFQDDGLLGFERENDKEGYFIINIPTRRVQAGLSAETFDAELGKPTGALQPSWSSASGRKPWTCLIEG